MAPRKTLLNGDTLIPLFPFNSLFQREFSFDNSKEIEIDPNEHWKNVTSNFVFEAKEQSFIPILKHLLMTILYAPLTCLQMVPLFHVNR